MLWPVVTNGHQPSRESSPQTATAKAANKWPLVACKQRVFALMFRSRSALISAGQFKRHLPLAGMMPQSATPKAKRSKLTEAPMQRGGTGILFSKAAEPPSRAAIRVTSRWSVCMTGSRLPRCACCVHSTSSISSWVAGEQVGDNSVIALLAVLFSLSSLNRHRQCVPCFAVGALGCQRHLLGGVALLCLPRDPVVPKNDGVSTLMASSCLRHSLSSLFSAPIRSVSQTNGGSAKRSCLATSPAPSRLPLRRTGNDGSAPAPARLARSPAGGPETGSLAGWCKRESPARRSPAACPIAAPSPHSRTTRASAGRQSRSAEVIDKGRNRRRAKPPS